MYTSTLIYIKLIGNHAISLWFHPFYTPKWPFFIPGLLIKWHIYAHRDDHTETINIAISCNVAARYCRSYPAKDANLSCPADLFAESDEYIFGLFRLTRAVPLDLCICLEQALCSHTQWFNSVPPRAGSFDLGFFGHWNILAGLGGWVFHSHQSAAF